MSAGNVTGAQLQLVITGDNSGALSALSGAQSAVASTTGSMNNTLSQVLIGHTLQSWGNDLLSFGQSFVNVGANFQQSIEFINRLTSSTANGFDQLQNKAITLARTSVFSAQDIVNGMEQLAREGFNVNQITEGGMNSLIDASVNMATALGENIPTAANMLGQLQRVFVDQGLNASQTADIVTQAVLRSGQGLAGFQNGLQYVAASADMTKTPLQDIATIVSYLESQLIKGRNAGTSLRTMFQNLEAPTGNAAKELSALGISTVDSSGNFIGLMTVLDKLHTSFATMTDAQQQGAVKMLFGAYASQAMLEVIRGGPEALAAFQKKETDLGSTADIAGTKMNNLAGSLHNFTSSMYDVQIVLGEAVAGFIKPFIDALNALIGIFLFLPTPVHFVVAAFVLIAGAIASITGAIIMFNAVGGMTLVTAAITTAADTMLMVVAPLIAIAEPLLALAAAMYLLKVAYDDNFLGFATGVRAVFTGISTVVDIVTSAIHSVITAVSWLLAPFQEAAQYAAALLAVFFIFGEAGAIWALISPVIAGALTAITAAIGPVITAFEFLLPILADLWLPFLLITAAIFTLKSAWDNNFLGFADDVKALFGTIFAPIQDVIDAFSNLVDGVKTFKQVFDGTMANDPKNWGWGVLASSIDAVGNAIKFVFGQSALTDWFNTTAILVQDAIDIYGRLVSEGMNPLGAAIESVGIFVNGLGGFWGLGNFLMGLGNSVNDAITEFNLLRFIGFDPLTAAIVGFGTFLQSIGLAGLGSFVIQAGVLIQQGIGYFDMLRRLGFDPVSAALYALANVLQDHGVQGIADFLFKVGDAVNAFANGNYGIALSDFAHALGDMIVAVGKSVIQIPSITVSVVKWIIGGAVNLYDQLKTAVMNLIGAGGGGNPGGPMGPSMGIPNASASVSIETVGVAVLQWVVGGAKDLYTRVKDWALGLLFEQQTGVSIGGPLGASMGIPVPVMTVNVLSWIPKDIGNLWKTVSDWALGLVSGGAGVSLIGSVAAIPIPSLHVEVLRWFLDKADEAKTNIERIIKGAIHGDTVDIAKILLTGTFGLAGEFAIFHTAPGAWLRAHLADAGDILVHLGTVALDAVLGAFRWAEGGLAGFVVNLVGWGSWIWAQVKSGWDNTVQMGTVVMSAALGVFVWAGDSVAGLGGSAVDWGVWIWSHARQGWNNVVNAGTVTVSATLASATAAKKGADSGGLDFSGWASSVKDGVVSALGVVVGFGDAIAGAVGTVIGAITDTVWSLYITSKSMNIGIAVGDAARKALIDVGDVGLKVADGLITAIKGVNWGTVKGWIDIGISIKDGIIGGIQLALAFAAAAILTLAGDIVLGIAAAIVTFIAGPDAGKGFRDATLEFLAGLWQSVKDGDFVAIANKLGLGLLGSLKDWVVSHITLSNIVGWITDGGNKPTNTPIIQPGQPGYGGPSVVPVENIGGNSTGNGTARNVLPYTIQLSFLAGGKTYSDLNSALSGGSGPGDPMRGGSSFALPAPDTTAFLAAFTNARAGAQTAIGSIIASVANGLSGLGGLATTYGNNFRDGISTGFSEALTAAQIAIGNIISSVVNGLSGFYGPAFSAGQSLGQGLADGISSMTSQVVDAAIRLSNAAKNATTTTNAIHSPSGVYREYGQFVGLGFALGMDDSRAQVASSAANMLGAPKGSGGVSVGMRSGGNVQHNTYHVTVPAANFKEFIETAEYVKNLDKERQLVFGTT